jgi:hypothetical protein
MAHYSELYLGNELTKLRDGLEVIERVISGEQFKELDIWLYGIVTDDFILSVAKEAIIANAEEFIDEEGNTSLTEEEVKLIEIAIAIPLTSSDVIDSLHGRGYPVHDLDFAYQTGEGEGVRTLGFFQAYTTSARLTIDDLKEQAIADSDIDLDTYLKQKGNKGAVLQIKRKVERNEEATATEQPPTEPKAPAAPTPPAPAPAPASSESSTAPTPTTPSPAMPKQTSLNLSKIVEDFLGG